MIKGYTFWVSCFDLRCCHYCWSGDTHSWSKSAETWISQWDCEHGIVALWNKSQFILVMLCLLIFSLEDWLWLLRLSKEPKIVMAKRIISEWQTWLGLYWKVNDFGRQWCGANPYPLWGHCRTCRYFLGCTVLPRTGFPSAIPGSTTRSKRCRKSMTTCRREILLWLERPKMGWSLESAARYCGWWM